MSSRVKDYLTKALLAALLVSGIVATQLIAQQDTRVSLFNQADETIKVAKEMQANLLAPKAYGKAMEHYRKADEDFKKGKELGDIRKQLRATTANLQMAIEATKLANVTLSASITARNGALNAEAPQFAADTWQGASRKFADAAETLEEGNVNSAKRKSEEAKTLFRDAELQAIKANYLSETWNLLKKAEQMDVKKYAPQTLKISQDLIAQAEKELNENRYDTDVARDLAKRANYEAKHAIYLTTTITSMQKNKRSWEYLILTSEKPLQNIAATMDMRATFDTGYDKVTNEIITSIQTMQENNRKLNENLADRNQHISLLDERIGELEENLGGVQAEKSALTQRMQQEELVRQQFLSIENLFTREEAMVLRQGRDIIIRLVGLNFGVGKSIIEPQYYALLTKVQTAVKTFPDAALSVEGHTDSYGSDATNLKLSEERAEAVRQYLLANMGLAATRVAAVGYGESSPIASNETNEGRKKNRRIDLVIHPNTAGTF